MARGMTWKFGTPMQMVNGAHDCLEGCDELTESATMSMSRQLGFADPCNSRTARWRCVKLQLLHKISKSMSKLSTKSLVGKDIQLRGIPMLKGQH